MEIPAEAIKLQTETETLVAEANRLEIESDNSFLIAGERLKTTRGLCSRIKATFDPLIQAAHKHHKSIIATRDQFLIPAETVEGILKRKIGEYQLKLDVQRREDELKRREEAMKRVEEEKLALAIRAEQGGNDALADRILETPMTLPVVALPEQPKIEGLSTRENWKFEIVDPAALPREFLIPDEKKIGQIVRAMKSNTNIPGIRAWSETGVAMRAK